MPTNALVVAATSPSDAWTKITNQMLVIGYTLVDTIVAGSDAVYSTNGVNGDRPTLYIRVTASLFDEAPATFPHGAYDNVTFRNYRSWNSATHTGKGEAGRFGRRLWTLPIVNNNYQLGYFTPEAPRFITYVDQATADGGGGTASVSTTSNRTFAHFLDGKFSYLSASSNRYLRGYEIAGGGAWVNDSLQLPVNQNSVGWTVSVDKLAGRKFAWYFNSYTQVATQVFYKYDFNSNTSVAMADPPWAPQNSQQNFALTWDGGNFIYAFSGVGSGTNWAKYNITANTWTTLATITTSSLNTNASYSVATCNMLYVPATLSGHANDEIYFGPAESTATWYRYNVTTNTWTASGVAGFPNLPYGRPNGTGSLILDPVGGTNGTIYYTSGYNNTPPFALYAYDLGTNTWGPQITQFNPSLSVWSGTSQSNEIQTIRHYAGALILPSSSSNLSITLVGNKDGIAVMATYTPPGSLNQIQRWAFAGFYNSYLKRDKFTLTAPVSPGTSVTLNFNEAQTSKLSVGDAIELFDPNANVTPPKGGAALVKGAGEIVTILSIPTTTSVVVYQVGNSYPANTIVAQDAFGAIVANDCSIAIRMAGANGYQGDGECDWYKIEALLPSKYTSIVGLHGASVTSGLVIYHNQPGASTADAIGELPFIFVANPNANANDVEVLGGHNYTVFLPEGKNYSTTDKRLLMIGPTDI